MDDIDARLLALLRRDARQPLKRLASEVGLAVSSVQERIRRLVESGTIRNFTIELGREPGPSAVLLLVLDVTPSPAIVREICARDDVVRCYSLSGQIDLLVEIRGSSVERINATRDQIALIPGVKAVTTSFILSRDRW